MNNSITRTIIFFLAAASLSDCKPKRESRSLGDLKQEIVRTEEDFAAAAKNKGIAEAFYSFADENAVIKRANDTLIKGNENIRKYYQNPQYKTAVVSWAPDFVDVSEDGNMGYTYGRYAWKIEDKYGKIVEYNGVFHTVWKRQSDGSWKYVWD